MKQLDTVPAAFHRIGKTVKLLYSCLVASTFLMVVAAHSADAISVFGLPLGSKLKSQPRVCPTDTDKAKEICWVGKPFVAKSGHRLGSVHLPNPDSRPSWAAYATFEAQIGKNSELEELTVRTFSGKDKHAIAQSIISRFGLPTESTLPRQDISAATWVREDIYIHMVCNNNDICLVEFRSPRAQAEREREAASERKKDAARPTSP